MDTIDKLKILRENAETMEKFFLKKIADLESRVKSIEDYFRSIGLEQVKKGGTNGTAKG